MTEEATHAEFVVALRMPDTTREALTRDERVRAELDAWIVEDGDMANAASAAIRRNKARIEEIKAAKAAFVAPAKQIIANAEALFDPAIQARLDFDTGMRNKLLTWTDEQAKLVAERRARVEAADRERRQAAEAAAAALRRKAEEEAAELRRKADEAAKAAAAAKEAGDAKAAAKLAAQAAAIEIKADAKIENADIAATVAVFAAAGLVHWVPAAFMSIGSVIGAWGAARMAMTARGVLITKIVVVCAVIGMGVAIALR